MVHPEIDPAKVPLPAPDDAVFVTGPVGVAVFAVAIAGAAVAAVAAAAAVAIAAAAAAIVADATDFERKLFVPLCSG